MNGLPLMPAIAAEVAGAVVNTGFVFLAARYAWKLTRLKPDNLLWQYLFYFTAATSVFAVARAVGHIAREGLNLLGRDDLWHAVSPWAGSFNTLFMVAAAAVTLFYPKGVQAYDAVKAESERLKESERELAALNSALEERALKRAERLAHAEKRFRRLFRDSNDIIFFTGPESRLAEMNPAGCKQLLYEPDEPAGLPLPDLFAPGDYAKFRAGLGRRGTLHDFECWLRRKDGEAIPVLLSSTVLFDSEGRLLGTENIAKDLTRLKSVMAQLAASEKMAGLGQMAAGIAHEINTPLGVILGYAQLMLDDFPEDSETHRNLEAIERQAKSSRRIISDLLGYARRGEGRREAVDLNAVAEDVLALTDHSLARSRVALRRDFDPNLPLVYGDAEQLRQVVLNLVNNAGQAMEELGGGVLLVSSRACGDGMAVCLEVRDSGPGVAPGHQARLFTPFFTTKPAGKGTGLGLSVSQAIVEEHGGRLVCVSPAPPLEEEEKAELPEGATSGPGALFSLSLPRNQPE